MTENTQLLIEFGTGHNMCEVAEFTQSYEETLMEEGGAMKQCIILYSNGLA